MTKREKVLMWIEEELVGKKRCKPHPLAGGSPMSMFDWRHIFLRKTVYVTYLSDSEKQFVLEAVRACGFTPRWRYESFSF